MASQLQAPAPKSAGRQTGKPNGSRPVVCQVLHALNVGGAEVLAARLARGLSDSFAFVFACLDELGTLGQELHDEGFPVHVIGRQAGVDWRCALRLAKFLRRQQVDVLHAHQYTPFFYAMTARQLYRRPAVLFLEHGRHQPDYPRRKRIIANRLLLTRRDRVVAVGQAVRRALIDNEGIPPERVEVIYNGVPLHRFAPDDVAQRADVRNELGAGDRDLVVIQVARFDYLKDHATAVRTIARVAAARPDVCLVLVGDGPERARVGQLVEHYGIQARVRFLGLRQDVPRLLQGADAFLLTSVSEGIPVTLIEAMAAGLPVVATDVGGVREVVEDSRTGFLAPAGDDSALAARLLQLAENSALAARLGSAGKDRAARLFSESTMHSAYRRLYEEMAVV